MDEPGRYWEVGLAKRPLEMPCRSASLADERFDCSRGLRLTSGNMPSLGVSTPFSRLEKNPRLANCETGVSVVAFEAESYLTCLEEQLHRQLDLPVRRCCVGTCDGAGREAEVSKAEDVAWLGELRPVEKIEGFPAQLKTEALGDANVLQECDVSLIVIDRKSVV